MKSTFVLSAVRTPIGKLNGAFVNTSAVELGAVVIREAIHRAGVDAQQIDEVLMGNVLQAGEGQAPARQAAVHGGVPANVGATTVNKVCGSALKAMMQATQAIAVGDANLMVVGGMENMSMAPYLMPGARQGLRLGNATLIDAAVHDGLWDSFENVHMGNAAEFIAQQFEITREEQDEFALRSHRRAVAAWNSGKFSAEVVPVTLAGKKGAPLVVSKDEPPRPDTSLEALAMLPPAFQRDGTVTAGNAPGITDGAAALVLASEDALDHTSLDPLARVSGYAQAAVEPKWIFDAPSHAIRRLLQRTGTRLDDYDLIEVNEAFAAQILANGQALNWDWEHVNVNGGAIALGHPLGATGARIVTTLLHALKDRGGTRGLACLCLGGGEAVAMSFEMV
ncbi:MAG: acetyl-CoA C-acetyltransferase [Chloroflexi bacterium]|nr:MAG: acetyl-CoA C-acetyltransferase [Chloroflexota bacterium]